MKRLGLSLIGLAVFSLMFVVACAAGETEIVEVIKEVVVEKEVIREIQLPAETIVVEKEVVIEVPVEKIVTVEKIVIKEVPVEKIVTVTKEVIKLVEVPVEKIRIVEVEAPTPVRYGEAPMLAQLVSAGQLPPVEERLPSEPMVMATFDEIGKYGGELRTMWLKSSICNLERFARSTMFRFNTDGSVIIPNAAKGLDISPDGKVTTIHLRPGMRWSDGAPFTADDFVYWYEDEQLNEELTPGRVSNIIRGQGKEDGKVVKVDDYTVQFVFPSAVTTMPVRLTNPCGMTGHKPAHYLKQFHIKYNPKANEEAVEAGFENWAQWYKANDGPEQNHNVPSLHAWIPSGAQTKDEIVFHDRNPYYFAVDTAGNQLPYIDRFIILRMANQELLTLKVLSGEVDFQPQMVNLVDLPLVKQSEEKGDYRVILHPVARALDMALYVSMSFPGPVGDLLRTKEFRQAISVAIDREAINQNVYLGMSNPRSMVPLKSSPFYPGDEYRDMWQQYDPDLANTMLDKILPNKDSDGFRTFADGTRVELGIDSWNTINTEAAKQLPPYWEAVGLKTTFSGLVEGESGGTVMHDKTRANEIQFMAYVINGAHPFVQAAYTSPTGWWSFMGPAYGLWESSDGEEGIEPTQDVKDLVALHKLGSTLHVEQQAALGQEIFRQLSQDAWMIGILGDTPRASVVKNGLGNVPASWMGGATERSPSTAFVEQFYWKR